VPAATAEPPPHVVDIKRPAPTDHHSLDRVPEVDDGSIERHVALDVIDEPPHGAQPIPPVVTANPVPGSPSPLGDKASHRHLHPVRQEVEIQSGRRSGLVWR
jgi:hypothetical protein